MLVRSATFRWSVALAGSLILASASHTLAQPQRDDRPGRSGQMQPGARGQQPGGPRFGAGGGRMGGMFSPEQLFEPDITDAELEEISALLRLSEDQADAVLGLFAMYQEEFALAAEGMRAELDQAREDMREQMREQMRDGDGRDRGVRGNPSMMMEMAERLRTWESHKQNMEKAFLDEVKLLLDEGQLDRWPSLERSRRRDHLLPQGRLSGEQLDLIAMVREMRLSQEVTAELIGTLGAYERELDAALVRRDEVAAETEMRAMELLMQEEIEQALALYAEATEVRRAVQEVNRRHTQAIRSRLPDDLAATFERKVMEQSHPRVFRPSPIDRSIERIRASETLDEATISAIDDAMAVFQRDRDALRLRLVEVMEEEEQQAIPQGLRARFLGEARNEQLDELMQEIRDLEMSAMRQMRSLLPEDEADRLEQEIRQRRDRQPGRDRPRFNRDGTVTPPGSGA
jgi:hypothetical protein